MRLVSCHYSGTANTGDVASSPFLYWDFGPHEVVRLGKPVPDCDAVIYGGGAVGNGLPRAAQATKARVKIAWGVGETRHGQTTGGPAPAGFDLFGSRDWGQPGAEWVPCASCMSGLFDEPGEPWRDAVFYWNRLRGKPLLALPDMHNETPLADVVGFLASAEVVVTNSYHGAYWATLLGRKVVVVDAYSSKLHNFRHAPTYAGGGEWQAAVERAVAYPDALDEARAANVSFHRRVTELISTPANAHHGLR